ncbi:MAG: 2OG-Fe(II) oxygenase [Haliea sp.]|jgi:SM-20-related protein|nr:2OG-Fe(II) oxygenase [Haliea sp.]
MSLINLDALRATPLQTDPYDYLVVPEFLSAGALQQVNRDYPAIDSAANHALENLSYGASFESLMEELRGPELATLLGEKFDMDLAVLPTTVTVRKFCERTDGNIHTDHKSKVITMLVYFNEHWDHPDGQLRLLRSKDDIQDYAAQVPPAGGLMIAFRRTDHSWHGHTRFVGERRMVQINYLDQSPLAIAAQRISRFGTHFMKNVLGMR